MDQVNRGKRVRVWLAVPLCAVLLVACSKSVEDQLADARLQQEIGSWQESIATLQEILNEHPDHPEANLLLGSAQIAAGQPALAIWPLEVAARDPGYADGADLALGAAYLRLEQNDAALAAADRVLARNPSDPGVRQGAIRIRASANLAARNWDAAIEDADRLLASNPESADGLVLMAQALLGAERIDEGEAVLRRMWDSPTLGHSAAGGRAGISLAKIQAYHRENLPEAEKILEELLIRFPQDAGVLGFVTDFLRHQNREEFATKLLRDALERDPSDLELRAHLAEHLATQGDNDGAEELLVEATELFDSPGAWLELADFYGKQGRADEALEAFERTLELLPGTSDVLQFRYGDFLAAAGELDRAEAVAGDVEGDAYRNVLLGRIAYNRGDYAEALSYFDEGLREWPNNAGARYLAGKAALATGDVERGITELREALRVGMGETPAGLELTVLYLDLGRDAQALATIALLNDNDEYRARPDSAEALVLLARAQWANDLEKEARWQLDQLAEREGWELKAVLERARFDAEEKGAAAAADTIAEAGFDLTDPANEAALRQLCEYSIAAGDAEAAVAKARAAVEAAPDEAAFHDVLGRVLFVTGRGNEAVASFDRALELDGDYAPALEGAARLRIAAGDPAAGAELLERATKADPANSSYPLQAAELHLAAGDEKAAEASLRETLRRNPVQPAASNNLAWILADRGDSLDEALRLATRASEADASAPVLDTLGWVHYRRGEYPQAVSVLERARSADADSPSIAYRLALALVKTGESERAADLFREALAAGSFPEAEAARAELTRLERGAS